MLSIVIPTHQRTDLLQVCLQAVIRHAPAGTEIVVVDDASPGAAASAMAASFGVRVVRLDRQRGFAAAANAGIRASSGDIVEMLNDDTEVQPGWADAALRWFDDPNIGVVAPLVLAWPDGRIIDSAGDRYYLGGIAGKRGHGQPLAARYLEPCRVFGASAAAGFYRRAALERVGLFPESFGSYFEDVDLAFRLNRAGYAAMYEPGARVLHHVSASYGRVSRRLLQRQSCNEELVFWRNLPSSTFREALPKHLAVLLGKALRRWDEGNLTPWLFGKVQALCDFQAVLRQRRELGTADHFSDWGVEATYWGSEEAGGILPALSADPG
ncbi:MAG: glycosyltransferase [Gemmataceae bacterium]|nr:glycosyltransferase [Gemmataceae bacterium]